MSICKYDVYFIIVIILFIYVFYKINNISKIKENFAVAADIKAAINEIYRADIESIRNLSAIATKLQAGAVTIPGSLNVTGSISATGSINTTDSINAKGGTAGGGGGTHFPFSDGINYIRGNTNHDGDLNIRNNVTVNGVLNLKEPTGNPLAIYNTKNSWLFNSYPNDDKLIIRGQDTAGNWTEPKLTLQQNGNLSVAGAVKVGASHDNVSSTISDSKYDASSLCIVGQGIAPKRKVTLWDDVEIKGDLIVRGNILLESALDPTDNGWIIHAPHDKRAGGGLVFGRLLSPGNWNWNKSTTFKGY